MCFFPLPNFDVSSVAYKRGLTSFDCGSCPECLRKRASSWVLRSVYEARSRVSSCMVTLTYDSYLYDSNGRVQCEKTPDPDLVVSKRHCQLFLKRLRKWFYSLTGKSFKYLLTAEYGSTTHRAHYHAILFGVSFPDLVFYKRSKRGNPIYKSAILTRLWGHGICTVDSVNINGAVARYCTKYCAKSRSEGTFMLASQRIGFSELVKDFSGDPYVIDGRVYPIPRAVWNWYIQSKYVGDYPHMDYRYVNRSCGLSAFQRSRLRRKLFRFVRDRDPIYCAYLARMESIHVQSEALRPSVRDRIVALPDDKYHFYKVRAFEALDRRGRKIPCPSPGSGQRSAYERWYYSHNRHLPFSPCPKTASDTVSLNIRYLGRFYRFYRRRLYRDSDEYYATPLHPFLKIYANPLDNPFDL